MQEVDQLPTYTSVTSLSPDTLRQIRDVVNEGVRRGRLPERLDTKRAVAETGLSARALHRLRDRGFIPHFKTAKSGKISYNTRRLFEALDALEIPTKTNGLTTPP